jgi:hypothetical protein
MLPSDKGSLVESFGSLVREMLRTKEYGGETDNKIERALRSLWQIDAEDGAYINSVFDTVPRSQMVHDLFPGPEGPPKFMAQGRPIGQ